MESYQISDLERLTGIKAHTIRIWEKRYSLIKPNRSETNRRYYNDEQVRKLLNVTTLLSYGYKISKIAGYSESELHQKLELESNASSGRYGDSGYVNDLISCMLSYDEVGFERVFSAAVLRMGLYDTMLNIIYPFMNKTGVLWSVNKAVPVQEHFASCIIRRKLIAATDGLVATVKRSEKVLLFLPSDEWHELGLLFANYILLSHGFKTVYLGQNLPMESLVEVIAAVKPDYSLTFFVTPRPREEVASMIEKYSIISGKMKLLVAGNEELLPEDKTGLKNVTYMKAVGDLLNEIA